jgi:hypothetical protein
MTLPRTLLVAAFAWTTFASIAHAQDGAPNAPTPPPPRPAHEERPGVDDEELSHRYQVGLRVGAGMPYNFAVKYGDGAECGPTPGETFCHDFGTPLLDVELGFGITDGAEISFNGRFGLTQSDVSNSHPIQLGLGIRGYGQPFDPFSIFFGARIFLDVTSSSIPNWSDVDFGLRGEFGMQYDFLRYIGIYAQLGASIAFLRAFAFGLDLTGGFQVRFP